MLKEQKNKFGSVQLVGVTPEGECQWAKVHQPDEKYNVYSITWRIPVENAQAKELFKQLNDEMDCALDMAEEMAGKGGKKRMPQCNDQNFGIEVDADGNETGYYFIKAKAKASGVSKSGKSWRFKPAVFDKYGKPFPSENPPMIGNGSKVRLAVTVFPYCQRIGYGLSIHLDAVQVTDLIEYNNRSATGFGFDVEEEPETESNAFEESTGADW